MSKELQFFNNPEFGQVRMMEIDGKPYIAATDAAKVLGYTNPQKAIRDHCKGVNKMCTPTAGGMQTVRFIPEGDLYRLIAHSKLPAAERFERWVFDEVLPTIRRTGMYVIPKTLSEALRLAAQQAEENEKLSIQVAQKDQMIGELKPKADYVDWILKNPGLVTITQIAKDYGMSGNHMNGLLHRLGIQYKQSKQWLLYKQYHNMGYTHSETIDIKRADGRPDVEMHTKWTQKGRLFIYELLKGEGIVPVIEQQKTA